MGTALTPKTIAAYSAVAIPMAAMGMPIAVYLPPFYSEGLGLSLSVVGAVFTFARVWDVVTDPIMGILIDRYSTRWGRFKHWIALSIPILLLSVWMLFIPNPDWVSEYYLLFWLVMLYIGYTMLAIAHQSWGADLSKTYDDRSRLFGWREIFIIGGMTAVLALPAILERMGSSDHQSNVASMGWFCLIMFPLTVIPTLFWVPDEVRPVPAKAKATDWAEALRVLASNRLLGRVLAADLLSGFGTGVAGALYIFMAIYVFELRSQASLSLLFYFAAAFAAMPMWLKLAYFWGKDNALKGALVYGGLVMLALLLFATPGSLIGLWSFAIGYGIAFGAAPALLRSMMADLTDEDELKHGKKRAGIFFALLTTSNKLGAALAVGTCFAVVEFVYGFVPGPGNSQAAIDGLLFTYCVGTSLGLMLAYLPLINYPLTRARHAEIREELSARNLASIPG